MARQANGKLGDGYQFMYKVKKAVNFPKETDLAKNHGIPCHR